MPASRRLHGAARGPFNVVHAGVAVPEKLAGAASPVHRDVKYFTEFNNLCLYVNVSEKYTLLTYLWHWQKK